MGGVVGEERGQDQGSLHDFLVGIEKWEEGTFVFPQVHY